MTISVTYPSSVPTWRGTARRVGRLAASLPVAAGARLISGTRRSTRFAGAYAARSDAERIIARQGCPGYDDEATAAVSFDVMCRRVVWDYPILFWLDRLLPENPALLDAGGHLGTKYIAFRPLLNGRNVTWTVYDLPGIVRAARHRQADGVVPPEVVFVDDLRQAPPVDILLASGLLQYLDISLVALIDRLAQRPAYILLNKVAVRDGPGFYTVERIGTARVPYQIRNRRDWAATIAAAGYEVVDTWNIPALGHVIPTHPWLGRCQSTGCLLRRTQASTFGEAERRNVAPLYPSGRRT